MRVIHFEIPAEDTDRAQTFYSQAFSWQFEAFGHDFPYFFAKTGDPSRPGIDGGLMRRMDPGQPVTCTIEVPSIDEACQRIVEAGGQVVVPKFEVPGIGHKAYFKDSEGNIFGIAELS